MEVDRGFATLLAAIIAAVAAVLTLVTQRQAEFRTAHRKVLEPHLEVLAEIIHQTVATSVIITKTQTLEAAGNWREKAAKPKKQLKGLRAKLRYPLWGLGDALHTLSRLPDWVEHARDWPEYGQGLTDRGDKLSKALDFGIRRSYQKGRPPRWYERALVSWRRKQFRDYYESFQKVKKASRTANRSV